MLLWEALEKTCQSKPGSDQPDRPVGVKRAIRGSRLPYDDRCAASVKSGDRCRGRVRKGSDFCPFHDPSLSAESKKRIAARGGRSRRSLSHIPGGYLRRLTSREAVGQAMDRLYRDVRLGTVTPSMGAVLFAILTRIMDSGLCDGPANGTASGRARADRLRPRLAELLTRAEKIAWNKAVAESRSALACADHNGQAAAEAEPASQTNPRAMSDEELPVEAPFSLALQIAS